MKRKLYPGFWQFLSCLLLGSVSVAKSQEQLNLDSCYVFAKRNYPLIKQHELIEKTTAYTLDNASKGYLPQVGVNGQASYQSDVTRIPIPTTGMSIPTLTKDQYKIYGEIAQPLTDVLIINQQKQLIKNNASVEEEKLEVELYKLKERVNQLYFGALLIDAQLQQTELLKKDIQSAIAKTTAAFENGTALKSNVNVLKAELLKAEQRKVELMANRRGFIQMLGLLINKPVTENIQLLVPASKSVTLTNNRPELRMFDAQKNIFAAQEKLISARTIPRLSLFFQGGYGKPALNMLDPNWDFYYIGGLRLSWNLSAFYTFKKDKKIVFINQDLMEVQRQVFLFNTQLSITQQQAELNKIEALIKTDEEILSLRTSIKATANAQLENGTITAIDYVSYVNAEDQAKQNKFTHQLQLLMAQYTTQTLSGN